MNYLLAFMLYLLGMVITQMLLEAEERLADDDEEELGHFAYLFCALAWPIFAAVVLVEYITRKRGA